MLGVAEVAVDVDVLLDLGRVGYLEAPAMGGGCGSTLLPNSPLPPNAPPDVCGAAVSPPAVVGGSGGIATVAGAPVPLMAIVQPVSKMMSSASSAGQKRDRRCCGGPIMRSQPHCTPNGSNLSQFATRTVARQVARFLPKMFAPVTIPLAREQVMIDGRPSGTLFGVHQTVGLVQHLFRVHPMRSSN